MITNTIAADGERQVLLIGRQGEYNHRQFIFDCSAYADAESITLVHTRNGDTAPYAVTTISGTTLVWTISATDTLYYGSGSAELRIAYADGLAKSATFTTVVFQSITGDTVIPPALQSWYDAMIEYIDEHGASQEAIEQAVADYLTEHPLTAEDVGALPDTTVYVASVNGKTGAATLTASDVGALPDSYVAPVQSVNGRTGAVVVDVPTDTADLTNSAGYITGITAADVTGALGYTPYSAANPNGYTSNTGTITEVRKNGATVSTAGVANITVPTRAADIGALPDTTTYVSTVNGQSGAVTTPNTTYAISIANNIITLTGSDGSTSAATLPVYTGGVI